MAEDHRATPSRRVLLALLAITVLGAALRWSTLGTQSLDGDELFTAWIVRRDLSELVSTVTRTESTPYPYYFFAVGATKVFGTGEFGLRSFSALAGTALIPCLFFAAREFVSARAALIAAALASVNPFLVWMSQQARAYSLLLLIGTLSLGYCGRYANTGSARALFAWAATGAMIVWTHYYGAFLVAAEAVLVLITARKRRELGVGIRASALPLIAGLVVLPLAIHQLSLGNPDAIDDKPLATRVVQIPKNFLVGFSGPAELWTAIAAALLVALALLGLISRRSSQGRAGSMRIGTIALLALTTPVALALVGIDYVQASTVGAALIACLILAGAGFSVWRGGMIPAAALCAISLAVVAAVAADRRYQRPDWRGAVEAAGEARTTRILLATPGPPPGPLSYYAGPLAQAQPSGARVCEVTVIALATVGRYTLRAPEPPALRAGALRLPASLELVESRRTETFALQRFQGSSPVEVDGLRSAAALPEEAGLAYVQHPVGDKRGGICART